MCCQMVSEHSTPIKKIDFLAALKYSHFKIHAFKLGEERLYSPVLSIDNMDRHRGGVYICTANNNVGKPASSQVVLHVLCKYSMSLNWSHTLHIEDCRFPYNP